MLIRFLHSHLVDFIAFEHVRLKGEGLKGFDDGFCVRGLLRAL